MQGAIEAGYDAYVAMSDQDDHQAIGMSLALIGLAGKSQGPRGGQFMAKVAINGLGRIGRATLKIIMDTPGLDRVAANDVAPADNVAYLLKYDTVYGF